MTVIQENQMTSDYQPNYILIGISIYLGTSIYLHTIIVFSTNKLNIFSYNFYMDIVAQLEEHWSSAQQTQVQIPSKTLHTIFLLNFFE